MRFEVAGPLSGDELPCVPMRRWALLAILFVVLAEVTLPRRIGPNQAAHLALVRALARGTPIVDADRGTDEDVSYFKGHYYSAKAPGLAFTVLPAYEAIRVTRLDRALGSIPGMGDSTNGTIWALGLFGCILPAALTLLLVQRLGGSLAPGTGTAAAVTIGLGTLLLPFSTLLFDHLLSSTLGFAAFALLWLEHERRGTLRPLVAGAAGLLAGYAVTCEYPLAIVAAVVGGYVLVRGRTVRTSAAYASGIAAGALPLVLYNRWAFGSFFHLPYANAVLRAGRSGHDILGANQQGFFGVGRPKFAVGAELLFGKIGLITLTPVVVAGVVGAVLLIRRGRAAEGGAICALVLAYLIYNSGYSDPWGGAPPGPRFLIPILPFLGPPLALLYRRVPLTTLALALPSIFTMAAVTATGPLQAFDGRWLDRVTGANFAGRGPVFVVPFALLTAASLVSAARATGRVEAVALDAVAAVASFLGWLVVALLPRRVLARQDWPSTTRASAEVALLLVVVGIVVSLWALGSKRRTPAGRSDASRGP